MAHLEPSASEDLGDGIGKAVLQGIVEEDFASSAVDALLSMVWAGGSGEVLGDVLAYLSQHQHPEWAAELCRMVMAGPDGSATDRDFTAVAAAMAHMVQAAPVELARKVCTYILEIKDNGQGGNFFDCYDISLVLGHMVLAGFAAPAGQILYDLYCDSTDQGQMYQVLVPHVLGTLIDKGYANWAIELSKQLMYEDGERSIDYTVMGWTMAQMVYCGRHDWAAGICDGLLAQHLRWYNQGAMLQAVSAWDPTYTQAIIRSMTPTGYNSTPGGGGRQQYTYHRGGGGGGGQHQSYGGGRNNSVRNFTGGRGVGAAQNGDHGLHTAMEGLKVQETNGPARGSGQAVAAAPTGSTGRGNGAAAAAAETTAGVASPGGTTLAPSAREFTPSGPVLAATATPISSAAAETS